MAMNDYGIDQFGKPKGMDQTSPFTQTPTQDAQTPGLQQQQGANQGGCPGSPIACPSGQSPQCQQTNGGYQWKCVGQVQPQSVPQAVSQPQSQPAQSGGPMQKFLMGSGPDEGAERPPLPNLPPALNTPAPGTVPMGSGNPPPSKIPTTWTEQWFTQNFGRPSTITELLQLRDQIEAAGGKVNQNASGQWNGKITDPNGQIVDIIHAAGLGGDGFQWLTGSGGGDNSGLMGAFLGGSGGMFQGPTGGVSTPAPGSYTPTNSPGQVTYNAPSTRGSLEALIQEMLTSTSLSPEVVAQIKEKQKGTILEGADQLRQQTLQGSSQRGTNTGGTTRGLLQNIGTESLSDISSAYRDVDINKALQDRTDQQNAANTGLNYEQQRLAEFLGVGGLNTERYATENQIGLASNEQAFQNWLREQGLLIDWFNTNQNTRQFDLQHQLALANFLAG